MAFDETPTYAGPIAALDEGTANLLNSLYAQRDVFANLPTAGNAGVLFVATNGVAGGGGPEAIYRDNGSSWDLLGIFVDDGAQTLSGVKTFGSIPVLPGSNPTTANQAARKTYVDTKLGNLVEDLSPQLGDDLDFNGSDASGIGHLGFLATQDASAGANDFDDYEEGSFTPQLLFGGARVGVVESNAIGRYVKKGREVTFTVRITLTSKGSSNGAATVGSLPFTNSSATPVAPTLGLTFGVSFANQMLLFLTTSATAVEFYEMTEAGVTSTITDAEFTNTAEFVMTGSYEV